MSLGGQWGGSAFSSCASVSRRGSGQGNEFRVRDGDGCSYEWGGGTVRGLDDLDVKLWVLNKLFCEGTNCFWLIVEDEVILRALTH